MKTPQEEIRETVRRNELLDIAEVTDLKLLAERLTPDPRFPLPRDKERQLEALRKVLSWL